jgi:tetratricopeptide (TPR) repeat protein
MRKIFLICILILMQAFVSYAVDDPLKSGMQLYKKNHYEEAAKLLYHHLSASGSKQQAETYLSLGLVYFANAKLYRELYHTSIAVQIDYLTKLFAADSKSQSRYVKFYLGKALMEAGELIEAAAFFKKFLEDEKVQPQYKANATVHMGTIYFLQGKPDKARNLWSGLKVSEPRTLAALAAAYSRYGLKEKNPASMCRQALDQLKQTGKHPSIDSISNIIEVYTREGTIEQGIELLQHADLKGYFQEETLIKNKVIRFYDSALLRNLAILYEKASLKYLTRAAAVADEKLKGLAQYYLSLGYGYFGRPEESMKIIDSFVSSARLPIQFQNKAKVAQAVNNYLLGKQKAAKAQFDALLQLKAEPYLVADILLACTRYNIEFPQAVINATALAQKGEDRRYYSVNFALGRYYLGKKDYPRATTYMEAGRDKSNKNRIEFNNPLMLVDLAKIYYLTKKYSESLEIYFEMSKQFPAVRQIQVAMQGVYSMEQKSAGDVKIF